MCSLSKSDIPTKNPLMAQGTLVRSDGIPRFGHFEGPVNSLGLKNFRYQTVMDRPRSFWARHFHFKQFQFVSVRTPTLIIGVALADIRYVTTAFCYRIDLPHGLLTEANWLHPLGLGAQTTPSPWAGLGRVSGRAGRMEIAIKEGRWSISLDTLGIRGQLHLVPQPASLPLAMCTPTGYTGWTYTQKHNTLRVCGTLAVDGKDHNLEKALAGYDFSAGYMRRETSWRWASINARLPEEHTLGLNLAAGVNETGTCENALWVDGKRHYLGPTHFGFSRQEEKSPWKIYSENGDISLEFTPHHVRKEKRNLGLLKSNFRQYIGVFNGAVMDSVGHRHEIQNLPGLTEDHYALW